MERLVIKPADFTEVELYEYSLVARPDAIVNNKVLAEKEQFTNSYKKFVASKTQPHITIANFFAREAMEETINRYAERVFSQQASFNVELNNYSGFPPNTIYLRVQNPQPFKHMAKELKAISQYIDSCSCPPVKFITTPHLTIARQIPETLFNKVLMDYCEKSFYESFMVNELLLLRRSNQYERCKTVQVFHLQPPANKPYNNALFN